MRNVRLLVMASVSDHAKHGYAIQQDIEAFAGVRLGPGTLYGALGGLERDGLVEALVADDRRRPYRLTAAGHVQLREQLDAIDRIVSRVRPAVGG